MNRTAQQSINGLNEQYVLESIDFIREHEPPEGYFVGFSGGKDSIVTLELVKTAGVKYQAYYSCTGIDPPEIYKFIRQYYPEVIWKYPKMSFWEGIRNKGVPFRVRRWCCDVLKKNPTKSVLLKQRIMGLRAEESHRRASRPRIDNFKNTQIIYKPIFYWLEWQIWEFIEALNIPYPSLYDEGFSRIGCIVCPFISQRGNILKHMDRWPQTYKIFEKVVKDWWLPQTYKHFQIYEQFLNFWYGFKRFN